MAGALMAFKCLTYAHTVSVALIFSLKKKEDRGKESPHMPEQQLLEHSRQWGLWNTSECNPGWGSFIASIATCLFTKDSRRQESLEKVLEAAAFPVHCVE